MPVTINDLGIGKLRKQLEQLSRVRILVGVQGEEAKRTHPGTDLSNGLIAHWLHYGTKRMPARPYVDRAIATMQKRAGDLMKKAIADLIDGRAHTVVDALAPVGAAAVDEVTHEIDTATEWAAPLAQSTIDRKGHDRPLVDTGTIRKATTYTIRDGESILAQGRGRDG